MNWRISRAVAALFIFSFLISSCDDPTAIGLELQGPGTQIGTIFTDTSTVTASTVLLKDSIIALGATRALVGKLQDPAIGVTTAKTFAEFELTSENVAFDPNKGEADSLVLTLDYDYYYGDTTKAVTWNVYRLNKGNGFTNTTTYFTNPTYGGTVAHGETPIGTVTFTPKPRSTYKISPDTVTNYPVLVRIHLEKTAGGMQLGREILAQSNMAPLKTQDAFVASLLQGLAFAPADGDQNVILGLNLNSNNSKLMLYYTSTTDNKPKSYTFYVSSRYYNQIDPTFTGALASLDQNGEMISSTATGGRTYLQAGTGLVTKLTFPYLTNLRKIPAGEPGAGQSRDLAINKAELIIPVAKSSLADTVLFPLPSVISVVEATASNRISKRNGPIDVLMKEGAAQYATLEFRGKDKGYVYVVNITNYVQNLMYSTLPKHGVILFPSDIVSNQATPSRNAQTVNRAILEANSQIDPSRKIELKVYYSIAK